MIKFSDLPLDMQTLISDYIGAPIGDSAIPDHLPLVDVRLSDLPVVPLDEYDRGTLYARRMNPDQTPPLIVSDNHFLDGKHRRFSFHEQGLETVKAIDLTGIADPKMVAFCSMGVLGERIEYSPEHERPDLPEFLVWDYAKSGFATKDGGFSPHPDHGWELSRNEIAERYSSESQYLIFPYLHFVDIKAKMIVERGTPELLSRDIVGWAWRIYKGGPLMSEWHRCESPEDATDAATRYVQNHLVGVRAPEPELLLAIDSPEITDMLDNQPVITSRQKTSESTFGL
jgi:hypothetical protein